MSGDGTVGKACDILDLVAKYERPVRFGELLEHSPFPKATLYRFLQTLTSQRMLSFDAASHTYTLGVRLVRLAHAAWQHSSLAPAARPVLRELSLKFGETIHLAQLDHAQVLYVDKQNALKPVEMFSDAGKVGPAYCTGVGKAMLAYLPEPELSEIISQQSFHKFTESTLTTPDALRQCLSTIKARGYAFDEEEHERGIICIAAPILTLQGRVLGALSITGPTTRMTLDGLESWAPDITQAAAEIAREVQAWRFPDEPEYKTGTA